MTTKHHQQCSKAKFGKARLSLLLKKHRVLLSASVGVAQSDTDAIQTANNRTNTINIEIINQI